MLMLLQLSAGPPASSRLCVTATNFPRVTLQHLHCTTSDNPLQAYMLLHQAQVQLCRWQRELLHGTHRVLTSAGRSSMAQAPAATINFAGSMDQYGLFEAKATSPAAERNKQPILEALQQHLAPSATGVLLEIASGSGQHVAHIAPAFPSLTLQPSDITNELFGSIHAYCVGLPNVRLPPVQLDASSDPATWAVSLASSSEGRSASGAGAGLAAMLVINMCHISPWAATEGLLRGAGVHLAPGGALFVYGPFKRDGQHTSDSNAQFDASLRARNPSWGYRDIQELSDAGKALGGLVLEHVYEMPANNFMLLLRKPATAA